MNLFLSFFIVSIHCFLSFVSIRYSFWIELKFIICHLCTCSRQIVHIHDHRSVVDVSIAKLSGMYVRRCVNKCEGERERRREKNQESDFVIHILSIILNVHIFEQTFFIFFFVSLLLSLPFIFYIFRYYVSYRVHGMLRKMQLINIFSIKIDVRLEFLSRNIVCLLLSVHFSTTQGLELHRNRIDDNFFQIKNWMLHQRFDK